jgi:hypothetical protein
MQMKFIFIILILFYSAVTFAVSFSIGKDDTVTEQHAKENTPDLTAIVFDDFTVSCNPADLTLVVSFTTPNSEAVSFRLVDPGGKTVSHRLVEVLEGHNVFSFDVSDLINGIYFADISNTTGHAVKKIIIDK